MEKRDITDFIIVHHSATARDTTTTESIEKYHVEHNGWDSIGYHRVIEGDGSVHTGMPVNMVGYHCLHDDFNYKSVAVCLTGNFQEERPSGAQLKSLEEVLKEWEVNYGISKDKILGHRETGAATSCPGDNLVSWLINYRSGEITGEYLALDEDVSTEIEDKYELKKLHWYSKYWTGNEFIQGSLEYTEKLEEKVKDLENKPPESTESGVDYVKRIEVLLEDKKLLESKLATQAEGSEALVKKINEMDLKASEFDKKYLSEVKLLTEQRDKSIKDFASFVLATDGKYEEYDEIIKDLERRVIQLQKPEEVKDMNKITTFWESLPKTVKVFCFVGSSEVLSEIAVELGGFDQTFLVRILAGLINLAWVGLIEGTPAIIALLKKRKK